jgi:ubiquinol-cytochrome c reductase cytochrome c1 subunit
MFHSKRIFSSFRQKSFNKKTKSFQRKFSTTTESSSSFKKLFLFGTSSVAALSFTTYLFNNTANASGEQDSLHIPHYPWNHDHMWQSYDHGSIRRGFHVYNTIGKACHSMEFIHYRNLVDIALTEDEAKELAAQTEYPDEPNEEGDILMRPGVLTDKLPSPYKNAQEARYMNNGVLPPDLSLIVKARDHAEDYVFALLTGYRDPPAGIEIGEGMYYNPYFPGCQISMPPPLLEDAVEYEDGTKASISQMAKDVVTYLTWSSNPDMDERHLMGLKSVTTLVALSIPLLYYKRFLFAMIKNRKVDFLRRAEHYKQKIRKNF